MKSAVTISLVEEAKGGPFVFWSDPIDAIAKAGQLGFDAVEIFPPDADTLSHLFLHKSLEDHGLKVAAVGTGAGWLKHRLHLADEELAVRQRAIDFIRSMIDAAAEYGAPTIIGSMQGRSSSAVPKDAARQLLRDGLHELSQHAVKAGTMLLYEPLNRYETDQANTLAQGVEIIRDLENVRLLADWFHMNIEECDIAQSIRQAGQLIGHVHFADTNRSAVGMGHLQVPPLIDALREIGYTGYLSAEVFPKPDSFQAAEQTIASYKQIVAPV